VIEAEKAQQGLSSIDRYNEEKWQRYLKTMKTTFISENKPPFTVVAKPDGSQEIFPLGLRARRFATVMNPNVQQQVDIGLQFAMSFEEFDNVDEKYFQRKEASNVSARRRA